MFQLVALNVSPSTCGYDQVQVLSFVMAQFPQWNTNKHLLLLSTVWFADKQALQRLFSVGYLEMQQVIINNRTIVFPYLGKSVLALFNTFFLFVNAVGFKRNMGLSPSGWLLTNIIVYIGFCNCTHLHTLY